MSNNTGRFFVGSLITFALVFAVELAILSAASSLNQSVLKPENMDAVAVEQRIKPVAEVNIGKQPGPEPAGVNTGEPPEIESAEVNTVESPEIEPAAVKDAAAETIVNQVCAVCHATGLMSAPRQGNAADWAPRIEKGIDTLYSNAINGFNTMPARGGRPDLSDDDVKAAVDYMVSQAQ